jgi:hypothetical protein
MKVQLQIRLNGLAMRSIRGVENRDIDNISRISVSLLKSAFVLTTKPQSDLSSLADSRPNTLSQTNSRERDTPKPACAQCSMFFLELPASRKAPMKNACQIAINTLPSRSTEVRARLAEDHRHTRRSKCNKASLLGIEAESHQPGWRICGFCRKLRRGRAGCSLVTAQAVVCTVGVGYLLL